MNKIAKNAHFFTLGPIYMKNWSQDPSKYKQNINFFHILDFNFIFPFHIVSLFHMYIDMGEMIAGDQDRLSLIIECSPPPPHPPPPPPPPGPSNC